MSIVNSTYELEAARADGRRWVTERHTDNAGVVRVARYFAPADCDYAAVLAARAVRLWASIVRHEIEAALEVDADPVLVYATKSDFLPVYREAYRYSTRERCAALSAWLLNRITSGWTTDTQVRNGFNLTAQEWTTLKAKMQALADHWAAVQAAAGE